MHVNLSHTAIDLAAVCVYFLSLVPPKQQMQQQEYHIAFTTWFYRQEVWDRFFAAALIWRLRSRFKYFVVDISKQALGWNFCTGSELTPDR